MTSTWPWLNHLVSGLPHRTLALLRLAFAPAPHLLLNLARHGNSPVHSTKGTPSPLNGLRLLVGIRFQVLFHSPPGFFSPFPHGTRPLSVTCSYLGLPDGPGCFRLGSSCPAVLRIPCFASALRLRGSHPLRPAFPCVPLRFRSSYAVLLPQPVGWFGLPPVSLAATPGITSLLFPPGTQMFHFPGFSSLSGCIPIAGCGFPHSDTAGSSLSYSSPARFAVRCVLLLRHVPRHPPYALSILIYRVFFRRLLSLRFLFLRFAFELFFSFRTVFSFNLAFLVQKDHVCLFSLSVSSVIRFSKIDFPEGLLRAPSKLNSKLSCFLLEKEVIDPHVPVGIPCYDLTPVVSPAFDGSLPCGLGHRLRALPTPMV